MNAKRVGPVALLAALVSSVLGQTLQYSLPDPGTYDCASYNVSATTPIGSDGQPQVTYGVDRIPSIFGNLILQSGNKYRLTNGSKGTYSAKPSGEIRFTGPLNDLTVKTYFRAKNGRFSIYLEFGKTASRAASRIECSRASKAAQATVKGDPNPGLPGTLVFYQKSIEGDRFRRLEVARGRLLPLPDGEYMRQSRNGELIFDTGQGDILIASIDGQVRARLTEDLQRISVLRVRSDYTLSPDGKRYAYVMYFSEGYAVIVRARDGELLAQLPGFRSPDFLPDGRLLLAGLAETTPGIYLTDAQYANPRRIDPDFSAPLRPVSSPDGRSVAFVQGGTLRVMNLDGSGLRILPLTIGETTGRALDCPVWSPDGRWIAVIAELDDVPYNGELMVAPFGKGKVQYLGDSELNLLHTSTQPPYCLSWR